MITVCKRTHQLKRQGDYWTIAKTLCGSEKLRNETTTSNDRVTCKQCIRHIMMIYEMKLKNISDEWSGRL